MGCLPAQNPESHERGLGLLAVTFNLDSSCNIPESAYLLERLGLQDVEHYFPLVPENQNR